MKKFAIVLAAALAASAFAGKCNVAKPISGFEKNLGMDKIMEGASFKQEEYPTESYTLTVVKKVSKPISSGRFSGLVQHNMYAFFDCRLNKVFLQKADDEGVSVAAATAYVRENGKLKAICTGDNDELYLPYPVNGSVAPNPSCSCYDKNGLETSFDEKTGCMEPEDVVKAEKELTQLEVIR